MLSILLLSSGVQTKPKCNFHPVPNVRSAGQPAFVHLPPHHATIPAHLPFANAADHLIFTVHQLYIPHQPVITISIYMPASLNRLQGVCWPIGEFINILEFVCFCIYGAWPQCPKKKWSRLESYGPNFVENVTQAIARDVLCYAMRNLRDLSIVGHVHDELIIEVPESTDLKTVCGIMGKTPPWAPGLLLRADGYECAFYKKD